MKEKLSVPMKQLNSVDEWVRELSVALDELTQCSYGFKSDCTEKSSKPWPQLKT